MIHSINIILNMKSTEVDIMKMKKTFCTKQYTSHLYI